MNLNINIFTVLAKNLKNVSERNCPFRNLYTAEIGTGMAEKSSLGNSQTGG
jgi:hypothetical protein